MRPAIGRWFSEADDTPGTPDTAIVSYGYWQRRLAGSPAAVGQHITIDSRPHAIIGVMPRGFRFLDADPDVILPQRFQGAQLVPNDVHMYMGIARLKPGMSVEQASNDVRRMLPIWIQERGTNAAALTAARFGPALRSAKDEVVGDIGGMLWLLMGTIAVVLLIACANVANLLLVRAEGRRQELTVRAALGAGWKQIARQLLAESVTLAILGGVAGLALAYGGLQLLVAIAPASLPRLSEVSIDPVVLLFTLGVSVSSALIFGLIPIAKYSGARTGRALDAVTRGRIVGQTRERHRTQNALVVLQVALAVVLLVASGLMIRSFQAMRNVHPGFAQPGQIQTIRLSIPATQVPEPERVVQMQHQIADRLATIPGVTAAAYAAALPMEMEFENNAGTSVEGRTYEGIPPLVRAKNVSPGLFKTLGTSDDRRSGFHMDRHPRAASRGNRVERDGARQLGRAVGGARKAGPHRTCGAVVRSRGRGRRYPRQWRSAGRASNRLLACQRIRAQRRPAAGLRPPRPDICRSQRASRLGRLHSRRALARSGP